LEDAASTRSSLAKTSARSRFDRGWTQLTELQVFESDRERAVAELPRREIRIAEDPPDAQSY